MSTMDYHERSYKTLCKAIPILSERYCNIALPLHPNFSYDLIVENKDGCLLKIKTLHTVSKAPSGTYVATLRKNSSKNAKEDLHFEDSDYIFIECPDGLYLIPTYQIDNKRAVSLSQCQEYKIIPS